jgi:putative peptide maturation dehydrogenase
MKLFRPAHLRFEFRDTPDARLARLLSGDGGGEGRWFASAAHLEKEVELEDSDLALYALVPETGIEADRLQAISSVIDRLLSHGVLLSDDPRHGGHAARDAAVREVGWWGPAALAHRLGAWDEVDISAIEAEEGRRNASGLIAQNGLPPSESIELRSGVEAIRLPTPSPTGVDELLERRTTCRNFDPGVSVPLAQLAQLLRRVFGAQGRRELAPGAVMLKKNSPSGGGLHPIEAYVLAQRVEGLAPGLYHYECIGHVLEALASPPEADLAASAHELVAGQSWFANAPVLILMAARFHRTFWKYPNHAKAWKVVQLDAGHLSQNLYLTATELGYGAFITGAINDRCAERLFELDGIANGAVAVCGFGKRAAETMHVEFDPLGKAVR